MTLDPQADQRQSAVRKSSDSTTQEIVADERRRALRGVLRHPLIAAGSRHDDLFGLVRRHAAWLKEWLAKYPGWRLHVTSEIVRLYKTPASSRATGRPAFDPHSELPFSRKRYALLCLALAALERADRQTTLGNLATDIADMAAGDLKLVQTGMGLDLANRDHRRDLVHVVRLLLDLRVLVRVHGTEQSYLSERGDVLYNVVRPVLAAMLNVQRGPSTVDAAGLENRIAAVVAEPLPASDEGRNRGLRWRIARRLIDDPMVHWDELDPEERAYMQSQRVFLTRAIEEATGLVPEVRAEGVAMADEDADLTDIGLPEEGTDGHVTLLVAEHLADRLRSIPGFVVSLPALHAYVAELIDRHRKHWRKDATAPGAEVELTARTLERLIALDLVRREERGIVPRPAIARYSSAPYVDGQETTAS